MSVRPVMMDISLLVLPYAVSALLDARLVNLLLNISVILV